ncbi:MAG: methyltransferase domain-containing protein [Methanocellales archaeon]|nr:methyltransferase domain-containing protein [Methanocellales archaeon]
MSVVLLKGKKREYLVEVSDETFHTDHGRLDLGELRDKKFGDVIRTHLGYEYTILKPRAPDFFRHCKRTGAPMMPKDVGIILAYTGLCPEDTVLDAGTGSGILAIYLGSIAKKVITYERNEEFVKIARENIEAAELRNVEVRHADIVSEIPHMRRKFDLITLDMKDAAMVVPHVKKVLKPGGFLATYSPFFEQTEDVRVAIDRVGFRSVQTLECVERELEFTRRGTRPSTHVAHTGFITIARL